MELYYHFTNLSEKPTMMLALDMVCRLDHCIFLHLCMDLVSPTLYAFKSINFVLVVGF